VLTVVGYLRCVRLASIVAAALSVVVLATSAGSALGSPSAFRKVVLRRGLSTPVDLATPRTQPQRLYVVEQRGTVRVIERGKIRRGFFLDVRKLVTAGGEQGLLGLAFDPRYASNHFVYVNYTDTAGNTKIVRYTTDGSRAIPTSARELLSIDQPYANHNGGDLVFGPDGYLYIGMGDGGSGGDPQNRAQNMQTFLGKLLRLDIRRPGSAPEIVGLGLRNPWRYSFDRRTGDLYIGDVGQGSIEEIDFTPAGSQDLENYGWNVYEGSQRFGDGTPSTGTLVFPVYEYTHARGCTVVGGYVYRGKAMSALRGRYVFGDYCSGTIWSLRMSGGKATDVRVEPFRISGLTSFGEDAAGELYAAAYDGVVYRLT
jgi:glucose/arabinose dehydrogenase